MRKKLQNERTFFFFFFSLFTFKNHWNLFWVYQNGNFLAGRSISRRGKNQEKWLCPLWKVFLLRPCPNASFLYSAPVLRTLSFRLWNCWLAPDHTCLIGSSLLSILEQCSLSRWDWLKWSLLTSIEFQPCIIYFCSRAGSVIHNDHKFLKCLKILIIK